MPLFERAASGRRGRARAGRRARARSRSAPRGTSRSGTPPSAAPHCGDASDRAAGARSSAERLDLFRLEVAVHEDRACRRTRRSRSRASAVSPPRSRPSPGTPSRSASPRTASPGRTSTGISPASRSAARSQIPTEISVSVEERRVRPVRLGRPERQQVHRPIRHVRIRQLPEVHARTSPSNRLCYQVGEGARCPVSGRSRRTRSARPAPMIVFASSSVVR